MSSVFQIVEAVLPKPFKAAVKRAILRRVDSQPKPVRLAARDLLDEISIAKRVKDSTKSFQALKGEKGLKVNIGCGSNIKPGFVNIDLRDILGPEIDPESHPKAMFINYDLRLGLPLEDDSCNFIYSSHFFEHLDYADGLRLMRDCYRALRSGGVFRMVLPNLKPDFDAYLRGDDEYFDSVDLSDLHDPLLNRIAKSGTMTRVDWINYGVYQSGEHKYIYDEEKAILLLQSIGYRSVASSSYQAGTDIDLPIRRDYSFYIEAVK